MTRSGAIGLALLLGLAAVCVRLGFWQIDRWHEKRRLNAATRAAVEGPVLDVAGTPGRIEEVTGRRVALRGRFDEGRQVLLSYRTHDGAPGVEVVTPLLLEGGGGAVMVDRGWLYASDGAGARPQDSPEPGNRDVVGIPVALRHGRVRGQPEGGGSLRRLPGDSLELWSARWLDADSLSPHFPYALASWMLRQLAGPGVPDRPLRTPPRPLDEWMHVSYAVQWFLFASILTGGPLVLAWSRRRRAAGAGGSDAVPPRG